jgi:predicted enzyme related to lactoylglutathione lyase
MNPVVHFEIPVADMKAAKEFYKKVFGWKMQSMDPSYAMITTVPEGLTVGVTGGINGGIMTKMKDAKAPVIVVSVPSIDKHILKIEKAGGKITLKKMSVHDMGFYARFKDLDGNVLGLWENVKK